LNVLVWYYCFYLLGTAAIAIFPFSFAIIWVSFFLPFLYSVGWWSFFSFFLHGPLSFLVSGFVLLSYLDFTPFLYTLATSSPSRFLHFFSFFFKEQRRKGNELTIYRNLLYFPYLSLVQPSARGTCHIVSCSLFHFIFRHNPFSGIKPTKTSRVVCLWVLTDRSVS